MTRIGRRGTTRSFWVSSALATPAANASSSFVLLGAAGLADGQRRRTARQGGEAAVVELWRGVLREPQAAQSHRQASLLEGPSTLRVGGEGGAEERVEGALDEVVVEVGGRPSRLHPHRAHKVHEGGVGAEAGEAVTHLPRHTARACVAQLDHLLERLELVGHSRAEAPRALLFVAEEGAKDFDRAEACGGVGAAHGRDELRRAPHTGKGGELPIVLP